MEHPKSVSETNRVRIDTDKVDTMSLKIVGFEKVARSQIIVDEENLMSGVLQDRDQKAETERWPLL
jgi:hypothetical protein